MTQSSPPVSIVMRSKNSDWVIGQALEGLFSQEYTHFELLVVDSGCVAPAALLRFLRGTTSRSRRTGSFRTGSAGTAPAARRDPLPARALEGGSVP